MAVEPACPIHGRREGEAGEAAVLEDVPHQGALNEIPRNVFVCKLLLENCQNCVGIDTFLL